MSKNKSKGKEEKFFKSNEVMMMLERMDDGIAVIAEQGVDNAKNIKEVKEDIVDIKEDIVDIKEDIVDIKEDIVDIKEDATNFRKEMIEFKEDTNDRLNNLQGDVTEIKHKLSEKVDREEFVKLEKRMLKLEKLVFSKI